MRPGHALFANRDDLSGQATAGSIAQRQESDIANALGAGILGRKSVNNLSLCTNGLVQTYSNRSLVMQSFVHGISGKSVNAHRRSYRGSPKRGSVAVFYWLKDGYQA
jgi:hypothetical protein